MGSMHWLRVVAALWIVEDAPTGRVATPWRSSTPSAVGRCRVDDSSSSRRDRRCSSASRTGARRVQVLVDKGPRWAHGGIVEALVRALVGDAIPDELVARVATASDGNCLFIEELLRTWVSLGVLVRDDATWRMTSSGAALAVPATVRAVYGAQLDDLPPAARQAGRAAVSGRRFPVAALPRLAAADPTDAIASLDRRSLISGPSELPIVGAGYAYRHALLRDAAYASLAPGRTGGPPCGARGLALAAGGRRVDEVAGVDRRSLPAALRRGARAGGHRSPDLNRATAAGRAAHWLERAAAHAAGQAAHDASADLQRRAIELTPNDRPLDAARRWLELGRALRRAGKADEAVAALERSCVLARAVHSEADEASPTTRPPGRPSRTQGPRSPSSRTSSSTFSRPGSSPIACWQRSVRRTTSMRRSWSWSAR